MNIKVKNLVRRVAKGKLKKFRIYVAFRVSQLSKYLIFHKELGKRLCSGGIRIGYAKEIKGCFGGKSERKLTL